MRVRVPPPLFIKGVYINTKYKKEKLIDIVNNSLSIKDVLLKLNLSLSGGNYSHISKIMNYYNICIEHFKGQSYNKGRTFKRKAPSEYLIRYDKSKFVSNDKLKKRMLRDKVVEYKCIGCNLSEWRGYPIPLHLHHIDGDRWNNTIDNLEILCPNCHSLTDNFAGKKNKIN